MPFPVGKYRLEDFAEEPQSAVRRTEMEAGPAKQALRFSRTMVRRPITMIYSQTEYESFRAFFATEITQGVDWFAWEDPIDGATKQARFVRQNPAYRAQPQYHGEGNTLQWAVSFVLEAWGS